MDEDQWSRSQTGIPQGGVLSPLLANIYLHYAFDQWSNQWRKRHARGEVYIIRYADDIITCFQYEEDGKAFKRALEMRLARFNLMLHPKKTKLIAFCVWKLPTEETRKAGNIWLSGVYTYLWKVPKRREIYRKKANHSKATKSKTKWNPSMAKEKLPQPNQRAGREAEISHPRFHELLWSAGKPESNWSFSHWDLQKLATCTKAQEPKGR